MGQLAISSSEETMFFFVSGPSGVGKNVITSHVLEADRTLRTTISCTTRQPRGVEVDGVDYYFWTRERFLAGVANAEFAEWAEVHGNYYGTLRSEISGQSAGGYDLLGDVDIQGVRQLRELYPSIMTTIFILPPSIEELLRRLSERNGGEMGPEARAKRLCTARFEIPAASEYDCVVVNDSLEDAIASVRKIIRTKRVYGARADLSAFQTGELVPKLLEELKNLETAVAP